MKKNKIIFLLGESILTLVIRFADISWNKEVHFSLIENVVIENACIAPTV